MESIPSSEPSSRMAMQCNACGAALSLGPNERATRCPYCASPTVVERPRDPSIADPTFVIGFAVAEDVARARVRHWLRTRWFAPNDLKHANIADMRGLYLPAYLYTAAAQAQYHAQIGENYTVVETYTTTDRQGRTVTRTRTRVETEWRALSGAWISYLDDLLVTASRGLPNAELEAIEPFDLRALHRFHPRMLAGWVAEDPSLDAAQCLESARSEAHAQIEQRLAAHMPGDTHRGLEYTIQFVHEHIALALVPVWVLAVERTASGEAPLRIALNGQTGALSARAPLSWAKITLLLLAILALVSLAVLGLSLR